MYKGVENIASNEGIFCIDDITSKQNYETLNT